MAGINRTASTPSPAKSVPGSENLRRVDARLPYRDRRPGEPLVRPGQNGRGPVISSQGVGVDLDSQQTLSWLVAIVQSSDDAILSCDERDVITTWNPAAERLLGYRAEEAIGRSVLMLVPPELVAERVRLFRRLRAGEAAPGLETKRRHKDGSLVDVEMTVSPVRDAAGHTIGFSSILRNISTRKVSDAKVRELEFRYQTFFEYMPGLTYIHSPKTGAPADVLEYSHQFGVLTGYSAEEWAADRDFAYKVVHPDDREMLIASDQAAIKGTGIQEVEFRIITKDGRIVWLRDRAQLVYSDDGQPQYWLGFMVDVSDRKRAEAETAEALDRLRATNVELERLSNAKSDFVSMISHEFRTPLTSIQGFSELLVTEHLTPGEVTTFASTINESSLRLSRMIGNVLDLDRLEAGQTELNLEPVRLNQVVESVVASLLPTSPIHNFNLELDPELPVILADPDLIIRVVMNLAANAIKYSPAGGSVIVRTSARADSVELSITDHGLGIPAAALETIFSRYARLPRPEQLGIEGTGLGLPIARHIVDLHGGKIWPTSDGKTGSCFCVLLPVRGAE